jgi:deoxyribodipyrimidine photo-lyase
MQSHVPEQRISARNGAPIDREGVFVLYWMIAYRRVTWNFSLQRAVEWAQLLNKPLVVLEALRCGYPWASDRLHAFILEGMADNAQRLAGRDVAYYPFLERQPDAGKGLLKALGDHACLVVTDDFPAFMLPHMVAAAAKQLPVRLEQVDSNGLLPLGATEQVFTSAYSFRRFLQKHLLEHLAVFPQADPLAGVHLPTLDSLPPDVTQRWPIIALRHPIAKPEFLAALPIDHSVGVVSTRGSTTAAEAALKNFLRRRLGTYHEDRNQPEEEATSGLSPYLHFGHIAAHQIFSTVMNDQGWSEGQVAPHASGSRSGWWGLGEGAEAFLDQLITWRELGFNMCARRTDYDRYDSLPVWAQATLAQHANDPRIHLYSADQFENAATHDPLWNAAQIQLVKEGRLHNYLRMLWGKKILHWSSSPQQALAIMIDLNNKYALDGRDPNSYSGIFWILGRYDRAWGPERPIFGKIRYMSSENTARKLNVQHYIQRYAP